MPKRNKPVPATKGWVVVSDMFGGVIEHVDCSAGGAQPTLDEMLAKYAAAGWTLEGRSYDSLFAHRGDNRIQISIWAIDPTKPMPRSHSSSDFS